MSKNRCFLPYIVIILPTLLFGCAGTVKHMQTVPLNKIVSAPDQGRSMLVFLRPSGMGYAIQSSVFEIVDDKPSLVGILAAKKKVSFQVEPGEHLFMVIGENADFMTAKLEENKTYYAIVVPKMGWWKARFSLRPIHVDQLNSSNLRSWLKGCEWVEKSSTSQLWANNNMPSIKSKFHIYYSDWMSKSWSDKPKLLLQDGKLNSFFTLDSLESGDDDMNNYYSPQDAVDSFDNGEYEYFSPQDSGSPVGNDADSNR